MLIIFFKLESCWIVNGFPLYFIISISCLKMLSSEESTSIIQLQDFLSPSPLYVSL